LKHANHYERILRKADDLYLQGGDSLRQGLELFDLDRDNIQAGRRWAEANSGANRRALELRCDYLVSGMNVLFLRRSPHELARWLRDGIEAARILGDRSKESMQLSVLSAAYLKMNDANQAVDSANQALAIVSELGSQYGNATVLMNLGDVYLANKDFQRSSDLYKRAFGILQKGAHLREQGTVLGKLGLVQKHLGSLRSAMRYYRRQLEIARKVGDLQGEQSALVNLGVAYIGIGERGKAAQFFDQALTSAKGINDLQGQGKICFNIALNCRDTGEDVLALTYAEASFERLVQAEDFAHADEVGAYLAEWRIGK